MFGWTYEYEKIIYERIAYGILWQALPIFIILYKVIPGRSILVDTPNVCQCQCRCRCSRRLVPFWPSTQPILVSLLEIISFTIFTTAPWGKTIQPHSLFLGPLLPPRISWCLMECPNLVWCWICYFHRQDHHRYHHSVNDVVLPLPPPLPGRAHDILLALFATHYFYRSILYPYRMSTHTTRMPSTIVLAAFLFCTFNG
jgi:hypothetical protein